MLGRVALLLVFLASSCGPAAVSPLPSVPSSSCSPCLTTLVFHNTRSTAFRLASLEVELDGELLLQRDADPRLAAVQQLVVAEDLQLAPGEHTLGLVLVYRGQGHGVFSYLRGYTFRVRSTHRFRGDQVRLLRARAYERVEQPLEQRLAVQFRRELRPAE